MTDRSGSPSGLETLGARPKKPIAEAVVSNRGLTFALVAALVTGFVFGLYPDLDLAAARLFYVGDGHFVGQGPAGRGVRWGFAAAPFVVLGLMVLLYLLRRAGRVVPWAPKGRAVAFLVITLVLGPGLLVNTGLKDHSHRPRPAQVEQFGGTMPFRPFYSFDGACVRNCSFVSGEGSAAFWTVAAALLLPARLQPAAVAAALVFGIAASALRMAFGGHFLSDTIFAALFTWLVIIAAWRMLLAHKPMVNHVGRESRDR